MKKILLLLALVVACVGTAFAADKRPNILFFLADDYGLDGVGCYGADAFKGKTPNIDSLAKSGIRLENAYASPR